MINRAVFLFMGLCFSIILLAGCGGSGGNNTYGNYVAPTPPPRPFAE